MMATENANDILITENNFKHVSNVPGQRQDEKNEEKPLDAPMS